MLLRSSRSPRAAALLVALTALPLPASASNIPVNTLSDTDLVDDEVMSLLAHRIVVFVLHDDAIARLALGHFGADRRDHAGDFGARRKRQRRLDLVKALHHQRIGKIHRRRFYLDQHLLGSRHGGGDVLHDQIGDRAIGFADESFHWGVLLL